MGCRWLLKWSQIKPSTIETTRLPRNIGRLIGPKPPLKPKHIWEIRTRLQHEGRIRRHIAGRQVAVETAYPASVLSDLQARGHELVREPPDTAFGFGGAQLVRRLEGSYAGGSDPRKDGQAGGF